ncbi:hypothetical protein EGH21_05440 [Halomicroarcula sp. F13]|uniref:Uncharacterized protein n=1 Tax=Haloarcula rubra TaxID=2487747 RepID=A0AAW4PPI6_9EURY|nr:hypothetical protein [Halomicroarcula rubra]MBX0322470.1 hypothetical protein [Halomicroarcula rubra]
MGVDLFASEGKTADAVTVSQNAPSSPVPTPILEIDPNRGQFLRFFNKVAKGAAQGIPIYLDLRDSNDDPLPVNTTLYFAIKPNGHTTNILVSEVVESIDQYVTLSISEQRNVDNIDAAKLTLQFPETHPEKAGDPTEFVDVRDIDQLFLFCDSQAQVDWSNSSAYIESDAVEQRNRA